MAQQEGRSYADVQSGDLYRAVGGYPVVTIACRSAVT
jgi:hypothetical protein